MKRPSRGSIARLFVRLLTGLAFCGLVAVVAYLLSDRNTHRYRLALVGDQLVVERGLFAPVGFGAFVPADEQERQAYAPIPVPAGEAVEVGVAFDDRSQVDRALFSRLASWAQVRLQAADAPTLELGVQYVKRLETLPSLSEEQRRELRGMRAEAALRQAEGLLQGVSLALRQAQTLFAQALELGTKHTDTARRGLSEIDYKLQQLGDAPAQLDAPAAAPTPPQTPGLPALPPARRLPPAPALLIAPPPTPAPTPPPTP